MIKFLASHFFHEQRHNHSMLVMRSKSKLVSAKYYKHVRYDNKELILHS